MHPCDIMDVRDLSTGLWYPYVHSAIAWSTPNDWCASYAHNTPDHTSNLPRHGITVFYQSQPNAPENP